MSSCSSPGTPCGTRPDADLFDKICLDARLRFELVTTARRSTPCGPGSATDCLEGRGLMNRWHLPGASSRLGPGVRPGVIDRPLLTPQRTRRARRSGTWTSAPCAPRSRPAGRTRLLRTGPTTASAPAGASPAPFRTHQPAFFRLRHVSRGTSAAFGDQCLAAPPTCPIASSVDVSRSFQAISNLATASSSSCWVTSS